MDVSTAIARVLGPVLVVVVVSEVMNFRIWRGIAPAQVHMNGMILFAAGVAILTFHGGRRADWTALVTLSGWLLAVAGAWRMFFPGARQAERGPITWGMTGLLCLLGLFLAAKGWG